MRSLLALISLPIVLLAVAVAAPRVASASEVFPGAIRADLSLSYTPPCTVCHATLSGGTGTVTRAFGKAMQQNGLSAGNTDAVQSALDGLDAAGTDSDCDGVPDVQQLRDGRDPNSGAYIDGSGKTDANANANAGCVDPPDATGEPAYGCGAQLAKGPLPDSSLPFAAAAAVVLGLALSRRRRCS